MSTCAIRQRVWHVPGFSSNPSRRRLVKRPHDVAPPAATRLAWWWEFSARMTCNSHVLCCRVKISPNLGIRARQNGILGWPIPKTASASLFPHTSSVSYTPPTHHPIVCPAFLGGVAAHRYFSGFSSTCSLMGEVRVLFTHSLLAIFLKLLKKNEKE